MNNKVNRAHLWQIGFFSLNNTATNLYFILTFYISYYATGYIGVTTVLISNILMAMRIFDGITDPLVGYIIDKTNGRFGKFRPFMVIGNIIMFISMKSIYSISHHLDESIRLYFFLIMYVIFIIGYTCQTAVTKAAQTCITNDPKQRPLFASFDGAFTLILYSLALPKFVSGYLLIKYNHFTLDLFSELTFVCMSLSAILTILAIIGVWSKDRVEFFGVGKNDVKLKINDYIDVIKNNRAIQMLIIAASTDKIASSTMGNAVVTLMVYGILIGNNKMHSQLALITIVPAFILLQIFTNYARKLGIRKGLIVTSFGSMIAYILIFLIFKIGDPSKINLLDKSNLFTIEAIGFIVLWCLVRGMSGACGGLTINAIADCSDYETYRTGRYIPGMMGTLFSFVDKLISSLSSAIIGLTVSFIGYKSAFPKLGDKLTPELFWATCFLFLGLPIIGYIASLIALKYYPLTSEKMEEIQDHIASLKQSKSTI